MMGCFYGCFRVKDENRPHAHLISDAVSSKNRDPLVSQNQLASLFLSEEKEGSPCKDTAHSDDRELKDEARFLKACGTLLETPAEIRKASEKVKDQSSNDGDSGTSKFHSWLPGTSVKKLNLEEQPDPVPVSAVKLYGAMGKESGSPVHNSISLMSKEQMAWKHDTSFPGGSGTESPDTALETHAHPINNDTLHSLTPELPTVTTRFRNKSVRFESESDMTFFHSRSSPSKTGPQNFEQYDSLGSPNGSKRSPYPTPLKLNDDMQTPGTVYPANRENLANGKNARIRSQYVYPVMNPVENFAQLNALKDEDCNIHQQLGHERESIEKSENSSPKCTSVSCSSKSAMECAKETKDGRELNVDTSLSHWLKPSSQKDDKGQNSGAISGGRSHSSRTPDGDRPIIGAVAVHWNYDEPSHISPKWWDGNGIPNSTNKYKEDQKVSWHATPFEERLEKALSEESHVYQGKLVKGRPIEFDENEESDTAVSRLQSSTHPESVVSF